MKFKFRFSFLYFSLLIFQNEICLAQSLLVTLFHQRPNHTKTSVADRADQGFLGKKEPNRPQFRQNLAQNAGNPFAAGPSCFNSAQSKVAWVATTCVKLPHDIHRPEQPSGPSWTRRAGQRIHRTTRASGPGDRPRNVPAEAIERTHCSIGQREPQHLKSPLARLTNSLALLT